MEKGVSNANEQRGVSPRGCSPSYRRGGTTTYWFMVEHADGAKNEGDAKPTHLSIRANFQPQNACHLDVGNADTTWIEHHHRRKLETEQVHHLSPSSAHKGPKSVVFRSQPCATHRNGPAFALTYALLLQDTSSPYFHFRARRGSARCQELQWCA